MNEADLSRTRRCACGNLRRATRALTQYYDDALRPSGVLITQFSVLMNVARSGPLALTQLADLMVMDRTTLTRNLQPLQKEGWLEVKPGQDQRTRVVGLTEQGESALLKAMPYWEQAQERITDRFGQDRLSLLLKELAVLTTLAQ